MTDLSPIPEQVPPAILSFTDIIQHLLDGQRLYKISWHDTGYWVFIDTTDNHLKIHKPDGMDHDWILTYGDLIGEDWIILND